MPQNISAANNEVVIYLRLLAHISVLIFAILIKSELLYTSTQKGV